MRDKHIAIARIRGGVAVGLGHGLDDCPYVAFLDDRASWRAWLTGFLAGIVSWQAPKSAGSRVRHVKHRAFRGRATWRGDEIDVIELGREAKLTAGELGALLGRSSQAVRVRACRLKLGAAA